MSILAVLPSALHQEKIWHRALSSWCWMLGVEKFCFDNLMFLPPFSISAPFLRNPGKGGSHFVFQAEELCPWIPTPLESWGASSFSGIWGTSWVQHPRCVQQPFPPIPETMLLLNAFRVGVCRGKTAQKRDGAHVKSYLVPK